MWRWRVLQRTQTQIPEKGTIINVKSIDIENMIVREMIL